MISFPINDLYIFKYQIVQNSESKELRWIDCDEDELPTDNPSVVRMFDKWLFIMEMGQEVESLMEMEENQL